MPFQEGKTFRIATVSSGEVLQATEREGRAGCGIVATAPWTEGLNQMWTATKGAGGWVLSPSNLPGKCLQVIDGYLYYAEKQGSLAEEWMAIPYTLGQNVVTMRNVMDNKCLSTAGPSGQGVSLSVYSAENPFLPQNYQKQNWLILQNS